MATVYEMLGPYIVSAIGLAILSFAWRENRAYRLIEHLMIGCAIGHVAATGLNNVMKTAIIPITRGETLMLIPFLLGILVYTRFAGARMRWISMIPIAMILGSGAGLYISGNFRASFLMQIQATMLPITFNNLIIIVGFISTLIYFVFTWEHQTGINRYVFGYPATIGRWFIMVYLGVTFTLYAISRLNMLIPSVQAVLEPPGLYLIPVFLAGIAVTIMRDRKKPKT